eukprot:365861-Chlamydomonas_euryale.AAC.2
MAAPQAAARRRDRCRERTLWPSPGTCPAERVGAWATAAAGGALKSWSGRHGRHHRSRPRAPNAAKRPYMRGKNAEATSELRAPLHALGLALST